jgi:hypothetical protein
MIVLRFHVLRRVAGDLGGAGRLRRSPQKWPLSGRAKRGRFAYWPLLFPLEEAVAGHFLGRR